MSNLSPANRVQVCSGFRLKGRRVQVVGLVLGV